MSEIKVYETLESVIEAHPNWEQEQNAYRFGVDLWQTAEKAVKSDEPSLRDDKLADAVFRYLNNNGVLAGCLTDMFREQVVRLYARGLSTTEIVKEILGNDVWKDITPFYLFKYRDVCGYDNIKRFLVDRLGYLKRSHARFPVKKYGAIWKEERASYLEGLDEIPMANPREQLHELSDHYQKLRVLFDEALDPKDKERYHKCMMRALAAIHLVSRDPSIAQSSTALIQEKRPRALPEPNTDNIIDINTDETEVVR